MLFPLKEARNHMRRKPARLPPLRHLVIDVVLIRAQKEMGWIYAEPNVALVANVQTTWDWTDKGFVRDAMRGSTKAPPDADFPVTGSICCSDPKPAAAIGFRHRKSLKPLAERASITTLRRKKGSPGFHLLAALEKALSQQAEHDRGQEPAENGEQRGQYLGHLAPLLGLLTSGRKAENSAYKFPSELQRKPNRAACRGEMTSRSTPRYAARTVFQCRPDSSRSVIG